jgi:hypothetical protein
MKPGFLMINVCAGAHLLLQTRTGVLWVLSEVLLLSTHASVRKGAVR